MAATMRRRTMVAGPRGFYPTDARGLTSALERMLAALDAPAPGPNPLALVAPHAGYVYSGPTAARAYKHVEGRRYERVIVIGPSHYSMFAGASVFDGELYETPLGDVAVDRAFVDFLLARCGAVHVVAEAERREHSVEVQVPFLQHLLGAFQIVPILICDPSFANCERLARELTEACAKLPRPTLLVASSDLYHGPGSDEAKRASLLTAHAIESRSAREFAAGVEQGEYHACGSGAITAAKLMAERRGAQRVEVVQVTTSHEVAHGSDDYVVGYLGAVMH